MMSPTGFGFQTRYRGSYFSVWLLFLKCDNNLDNSLRRR